MDDHKDGKKINIGDGIGRRDFLKVSGTIAIGAGAAVADKARADDKKKLTISGDVEADLPPSRGYILVDTKKCQGCVSCMLACSLAHEGRENLSLSRIQVIQDPFGKFPQDISVQQCRQCVDPECLKQCPTGALHVDADNGNVRTVNEQLCIGCLACIKGCPHAPARAIWNHEEKHAQKCDLCSDAKFWSEPGGPGGKQACVEVCPVGAIKFQSDIPVQEGVAGYKVNLRGEGWEILGYPTD